MLKLQKEQSHDLKLTQTYWFSVFKACLCVEQKSHVAIFL